MGCLGALPTRQRRKEIVSDADSALHALSEQLERFFKDQPELITIAVLMAAHTTLEVLAKHSVADPAEMAQRVEAFIIEQRKVAYTALWNMRRSILPTTNMSQ
jgi:hypothetical protein